MIVLGDINYCMIMICLDFFKEYILYLGMYVWLKVVLNICIILV